MANGRIVTGFSKPYVAKYKVTGSSVSYENGMPLARGVNVTISPETSSDNIFYADNQAAESAAGTFTGGSVTLTVDGLKLDAEKLVMGVPDADDAGWTAYGDTQVVPDVGVGFIVRYMSGSVVTYVPYILCKCKFDQVQVTANTQESDIDWQTQSLTASLMRSDNANHDWKLEGAECATEAAAEAALKAKLGIS